MFYALGLSTRSFCQEGDSASKNITAQCQGDEDPMGPARIPSEAVTKGMEDLQCCS